MIGEQDDASNSPRPRRGLITFYIMLASFMQAIDTTIANIALPRIQGSLSATQDQTTWVLTSYIIAAAIMTPLSGWLAGVIGRKRVFLYSVAGFVVASILCGVSQNITQIVAARLLQGLCGAALIPLSQAVLLDINPPERHGRAMAIWVMGATLAPIIGPVLGGWLTENYNWRWVFYINVPVGILAFMGILSSLPETATQRVRFDFLGFASLSLGIGALQLTLDRGQLKDWFSSTEIWIETTVAATAFYLFIVHMLTTTKQRFVSGALFKDRNFFIGNVLVFTFGVVLYATLALLPPLLQSLLNYPVVTTGLVIAPRGIASMLSLFVVGRVMGRLDIRLLIGAGLAMGALSAWQMTQFDLLMDASTVVWSGIAQGLGSGMIFVPVSVATFSTLSPALRNEGAAIFSLTRNVGTSAGISVVEMLLTRNTQVAHAGLAEHVTRFGHQAMTPQALAALNATITKQAAMIAYINDFYLLLVLCLAAIPLAFLLHKSARSGAAAVAVE